MKLSNYIFALTQIMEQHGELEVDTYTPGPGGRSSAQLPTIAHRRVLKGRESRPEFWAEWEIPERKGEKVVKV